MEIIKPKIIEKLWGREEWLVNNEKYCGKLLHLKKGFQSSLHKHKNKDETFYLLKGKLMIEVNGKEILMKEGESIRLFPGDLHRFNGIGDAVVIEISTTHEDSDSYREEGQLSGKLPKEILNKYGEENA